MKALATPGRRRERQYDFAKGETVAVELRLIAFVTLSDLTIAGFCLR
jgi:hypothetical protein